MIISLGNYNVHIGDEAIAGLEVFLEEAGYHDRKIFIMADENTFKHCLPILLSKIEILQEAEIIEVANGEENKNIDVCIQVWEMLTEKRATRNDLLICLGGGVICDMGGFIASTFKRGMHYLNIPTTLLAQVDASVGGKVGIDLNGIKNLVGLFTNPKAVFVYPTFLYSLDRRQILSGFAEIIKHALVADKKYWNQIKKTDLDHVGQLTDQIARSIEIKNEIVTDDPTEKGMRKALNFGHTIGHAIETFSMLKNKLPLLHGEAVAIGMVCEAFLSRKLAGLSGTELSEIVSYIKSLYPPYSIPVSTYDYIIDLMKDDKKSENGELNFSLISKIGTVKINHSCNEELIRDALEYYRTEFNDAVRLN